MELDPWGPIVGRLFEDGSSDYILGLLQRAGIASAIKSLLGLDSGAASYASACELPPACNLLIRKSHFVLVQS